jgi:hypothetical protein
MSENEILRGQSLTNGFLFKILEEMNALNREIKNMSKEIREVRNDLHNRWNNEPGERQKGNAT